MSGTILKVSVLLLSVLSVLAQDYEVYHQLQIVQPRIEELEKSQIDFTIANFGKVPYGQTISGVVELANPVDGCTPLNRTIADDGDIHFVLIKRGASPGSPEACHFVQKVRYAEQAGYKLAIIEDNIVETQFNYLIMSDDGKGQNIKIPSIFINNAEGVRMTEFLERNETLRIRVGFTHIQSNSVAVKMILSARDKQAYAVTADLKNKLKQIQVDSSEVTFQPRYLFQEMMSWQDKIHCANPKYCYFAPDRLHEVNGNGAQVVQESIRQICIYDEYGQAAWFNYMEKFIDECALKQSTNYEKCSAKKQKQVTEITDENKIVTCASHFFTNAQDAKSETHNPKYDKYVITTTASALLLTIQINDFVYQGNLKGWEIVEAICSTLEKHNPVCDRLVDEAMTEFVSRKGPTGPGNPTSTQQDGGLGIVSIVLITVTVLIVIFIIILIVYKKIVGREMTTEMNTQVSEMVSSYIKFYEHKQQQGTSASN